MKRILRVEAIVMSLVMLLFAGVLRAQGNAAESAPTAEIGILLMAHGGSKNWNEQVSSLAARVDKKMPTEVALGMASRATLQAGVDKLAARGVKRIVAVPLFISSHSSVIESTRYLLGLRADAPGELADFAGMDHDMAGMNRSDGSRVNDDAKKDLPKPVSSSVPMTMAPALDRHPLVAAILADRAAAIARNPARDVVILVAHGPNEVQDNARWLADMAALAQLIAAKGRYARIEYVTVRDDADAPVREQATAELRNKAQAADDNGYHALIVPLLLAYGGIENGIRARLDGVEHSFAQQGLLPDERIEQWVLESARSTAIH